MLDLACRRLHIGWARRWARDQERTGCLTWNLRLADRSANMQNKRAAMSNNKSCGLLGVTWNKQHRRWQSKLMANKKRYHVGYFETAEQAHAAYLLAKRRLHPASTI